MAEGQRAPTVHTSFKGSDSLALQTSMPCVTLLPASTLCCGESPALELLLQ